MPEPWFPPLLLVFRPKRFAPLRRRGTGDASQAAPELWFQLVTSVTGERRPNRLGGIFSGYFTPSEAAAVAVVYALLVSTFVYRDMSFKKLYTTMLGSAKTSAVIMIIIACSGPFGWALANWKIPEAISTAVLSVSTNKYVILFLISLIILIAGVFMETSSAIIILTPVFLPLVRALGISTLHFGILFVVGITIGMITPPVAINLFVASGITGLSLEKISKAVVPYLIGLVIVFLLIVYLPLFIPGFIG